MTTAPPQPTFSTAAHVIRAENSSDKTPGFQPAAVPAGLALIYMPGQLPPPGTILTPLRDWELAVMLLPERDTNCGEYYELRDIAPAMGTLKPMHLCTHAQRLFPRWEGWYRLNLEQAVRLIRYYQQCGQRKYSRADLERLVNERAAERHRMIAMMAA